jgi:hypothetical protein
MADVILYPTDCIGPQVDAKISSVSCVPFLVSEVEFLTQARLPPLEHSKSLIPVLING